MIQHKILRALEEARSWVILAHEKPDGDTLGCGSAIFQRGIALGKTCSWLGPDPFPRVYRFLPCSSHYRAVPKMDTVNMTENSLVIALDTSNPERSVFGTGKVLPGTSLINVDHHGDNSLFGTLNWIAPDVSSVGEMVYELFSLAGWKMSNDEAVSLLPRSQQIPVFSVFPQQPGELLRSRQTLFQRGRPFNGLQGNLRKPLCRRVASVGSRALPRVRSTLTGSCAPHSLPRRISKTLTDQGGYGKPGERTSVCFRRKYCSPVPGRVKPVLPGKHQDQGTCRCQKDSRPL